MQHTPWWGTPLMTGIFAFLGVLLAQGVTVFIDARRGRREDDRRWHADRREIYVEFISAAYNVVEYLRAHWVAGGGTAELEQLRDVLVSSMQKIQLTATRRVVDAAVKYRDALLTAINAYLNDHESTSFDEQQAKLGKPNVSFVLAARDELGVTTGDARPTAPWGAPQGH
jgi:hypothetical protein